ncbi:hypothetical protein XENOCAPTIV_018084 [Xenoophorus captivus]|uniref:Uncharacterized protein n=1 Tax=Xenoophorus captivus TaxID=1517983 RepID=A0ABV0S059_9TELE
MTHRNTSKLYQGLSCCFTSTDPDLDSYKTTKKKNAESLKRKLCPSPDEMGCIPLKSELSGVEDIDTSLDIDDDSKTNLTSRKTTQGQHTKTTNPNPCIKSLLPNNIKTAAIAPIYDGYPIHYHGNSFISHENISLSCSEGIDHDCGPSFDSSSCRPVGSLPLKGPNMNDCPETTKVKHSLQSLCVLSDNMEEIKESNETVNISVPNNSAHPSL